MKYFILITLIFISFKISGQGISKSDLLGCWTSSSEEDIQGSGISTYRPCDYKFFQPSRFRFKMDLKVGSMCSWFTLAPNDAHYMQDGTWKFNEKTNELILFNLDGEIGIRFIIVEAGYNILKIRN